MLGSEENMDTEESSPEMSTQHSHSAEIKFPKFPKSPARSSDGSSSPTSLTFSWARMVAGQEEEEEENNQSPPLWRPGSSMSNPSHPMSLRAQEIARGRQELMKLYEGMPESAYELSLKDLVDQKAAMEKLKMGNSDEPKTRKGVSGNSKKRTPLKDNYPKSFLLNIFVPSILTVRPTPLSRPLSPNSSRRSNDQSVKNNSNQNFKRHRNPLLSLFRIRPSKGSELSHSNSFSKVSPRPDCGQSDLSITGNPIEAKPNNSSRCAACSGYTVFFMTNCQACEKTYCNNCVKEATIDTPKGRRCSPSCTDISYDHRDLEPQRKGCWPSLSRKKPKSARVSKNSFRQEEI